MINDPFQSHFKEEGKALSLGHWYFISHLTQEEIRVISLLTIYETWESEAEGMPGWKNCILKSKYLCQTSSALWTGHTLCRHKYWALFLQLLTDSLFPCPFCWGSRPYRPCAVLLLTGLDLQCCFFDETGWQLHQFWGSVEFYSISWYCIFLLVLGVLQVKTFCCVFLAEFCCC